MAAPLQQPRASTRSLARSPCAPVLKEYVLPSVERTIETARQIAGQGMQTVKLGTSAEQIAA